MQRALIVAGPTASGKSALAEALARRFGGVVINADAMQCYRGLEIITAQPAPSEVPHLLYGVRDPAEPADVAWWREQALAAMEGVNLPILCGGTGLYLRALTCGIAAIPPVPPAVRAATRAALARRGSAALHAELDAETAAQLRPTDSQRVARAHEVLWATGRGLAAWQRQAPALPPAPRHFAAILLDPPREELRRAIEQRFDAMLQAGAVEEVRRLLDLPDDLPAMRAHGVPELRAFLRGEITLAEARRRAILHTGQYTKRQATWFRHQPLVAARDMHRINARFAGLAQFPESLWAEVVSFVRRLVDGG